MPTHARPTPFHSFQTLVLFRFLCHPSLCRSVGKSLETQWGPGSFVAVDVHSQAQTSVGNGGAGPPAALSTLLPSLLSHQRQGSKRTSGPWKAGEMSPFFCIPIANTHTHACLLIVLLRLSFPARLLTLRGKLVIRTQGTLPLPPALTHISRLHSSGGSF